MIEPQPFWSLPAISKKFHPQSGLLLIKAKENGVLSQKQDGLYYSEIKIGSNLDLAVEYLKNDKVLTSEIKKETFPELEKKTKK